VPGTFFLDKFLSKKVQGANDWRESAWRFGTSGNYEPRRRRRRTKECHAKVPATQKVPGTFFLDKFLSKKVQGANVWGESAGRFGPSGIMNHEGAEGAQRKDGCKRHAKGARHRFSG
jgi:hypothetical protein